MKSGKSIVQSCSKFFLKLLSFTQFVTNLCEHSSNNFSAAGMKVPLSAAKKHFHIRVFFTFLRSLSDLLQISPISSSGSPLAWLGVLVPLPRRQMGMGQRAKRCTELKLRIEAELVFSSPTRDSKWMPPFHHSFVTCRCCCRSLCFLFEVPADEQARKSWILSQESNKSMHL